MMARRKAEVEQTTSRDGKMAAAGNGIDDDHGEHEPTHNVAADQLLTLIERIERLMEEKSAVGADIKQVFGEAKGLGYDNKAMRRIIAIRAKDHGEYLEEEAILETYLAALGMI